MTVGRNIRAIRKSRGLTLDELSALSGVCRDDLGGYELGKLTPRPATVEKIARALNVPIATIREGMAWTEPRPTEPWENAGDDSPLYEGIVETLRECGESLEQQDVLALMESVKASIPALIDYMKDTRPEHVINTELLAQLDISPEEHAGFEDLTDEQWEQVRELLPPENAGKGRAFKSNRLMLNSILYRMRSGAPWRDLPERYGRYQCVADRLRLWERTGVWPGVAEKLRELGVIDTVE